MKIVRSMRPLLFVLGVLAVTASSFAQFGLSITVGPPPLPVYEQPVAPGDGYMWTPGYWAYGPAGYFWVPGTWVMAPQPGLLWTPGYWGWNGGYYGWHEGYWGPTIGFYGGVNYGFGYVGSGYQGGYWRGGQFYYNQNVNNVNVTNVHNTYNTTVINNTTVNNVSYNGGTGGTTATPTPQEQAAAQQPHVAPTAMQTQHQQAASTNRALLASVNNGKPAIAATSKPGEFSGPGVVAAKAAAPYKPAASPAAVPAAGNNVPRPGNTVSHPPAVQANTSAPHPPVTQPHTQAPPPKPPAPKPPAHPASQEEKPH